MPTVYVTQEAALDFSQAEKFGDIEFITSKDIVNIRSSGHNRDLVEQIWKKLGKYDRDNDFVVIAGSPYVAGLVFMVLALKQTIKGHSPFVKTKYRVLRWSNRDKKYTPVEIEV
jgi:hypothetical protein